MLWRLLGLEALQRLSAFLCAAPARSLLFSSFMTHPAMGGSFVRQLDRQAAPRRGVRTKCASERVRPLSRPSRRWRQERSTVFAL
jgi:hypothetical protein